MMKIRHQDLELKDELSEAEISIGILPCGLYTTHVPNGKFDVMRVCDAWETASRGGAFYRIVKETAHLHWMRDGRIVTYELDGKYLSGGCN